MKITPVVGTPTIQQPSNSGLSPDKLIKIKNIAIGGAGIETTKEDPPSQGGEISTSPSQETGTEIGQGGPTVPKPSEGIKTDDTVQAIEATKETEPISPQLAALARQRRALQVKEKELEEKARALTGPSRADLEARIKSSPLSVLQEFGVTYDQLTKDILASQGQFNPEIDTLKSEIESLKKGMDNRFNEAKEAQEVAAINYVADKLDNLTVDTGWEVLKEADGQEEVVRRVYDHWKKTGKELDIRIAAKEYQDELIEEAIKFAKIEMVQKRLNTTEPAKETLSPQPTKTLTNKDSARPTMGRKERAILAMQGQLKR